MPTPSTVAVHDLLVALFSGSELEAFVATYYRRLAARIDWQGPVSRQAGRLIELWREEGLYAEPSLYACLRDERPARAPTVDLVERAVQQEQDYPTSDGEGIDESMAQHVRTIEQRRLNAWARAETSPRSAAHVARLTIEEIALQLHLREIGPTRERRYDEVFAQLTAGGVIAGEERGHFAIALEPRGSGTLPRSEGEPGPAHLAELLTALDRATAWYFAEYLKLDIGQIGLRSTRHSLMPAPPDLTPLTLTSMGSTLGTCWLEGELVPIWRDHLPDCAGQLRVAVSDGEVVRQLELRVDATRPRFVGRGRTRRDGRTHNDLVLPSRSVSKDQAEVEVVGGRVFLRNTSTKANVAIGIEWLRPGASKVLHHRASFRFGRVSGVFLDARLYEAAPESTVDAATGLLAREGLSCEIALTLAGRRERVAFFVRYSPDNEHAAVRAALLLHQSEPALPAARMRNVAAVLGEAASGVGMSARLETLRGAGLAPSVTGYLRLEGDSTHANAIIEAAIGALRRLAAAGAGAAGPLDLARYAIPTVSLSAMMTQAAAVYAGGGGIVVFVLEEIERLVELDGAAHAAVELEFREMLGGALGPADCICPMTDGMLAVLTRDSVDKLAREQPAKWLARGPIQIGVLELERCVRALPLPEESVDALVAEGAAFVREAMSGIAAHMLPLPIAHPVEQAAHTHQPAARLRAIVRALEHCWQLVACVLAAAHRQRFRNQPLDPPRLDGWAQPWLELASAAATQLLEADQRVAELALATQGITTPSHLAGMATMVARADTLLALPEAPPDALARAHNELQELLRAALAALRPLRGWSLVGVHRTRALDIDGHSMRVDYTDFTGPDTAGVHQRISVTGLPVHEFVYLARWGEGVMVVLDPWIRRARNPVSGHNELFMIEEWPRSAGHHRYRAVAGDTTIQLEVTRRHLGR